MMFGLVSGCEKKYSHLTHARVCVRACVRVCVPMRACPTHRGRRCHRRACEANTTEERKRGRDEISSRSPANVFFRYKFSHLLIDTLLHSCHQ